MTAPAFCACCLEERADLEPVEETGVNGNRRVVWRCADCLEAGPLSDLAQHDILDEKDRYIGSSRDGGRQRPKGGR